MKILVVSDVTAFALTDIYAGYIHAMSQLKIPFEVFSWHRERRRLADDTCWHIFHSEALLKCKEFTHVFFIGGLSIPQFLLESFYHVKTITIATEDPHTWTPQEPKLQNIDYYFTNERSIARCGLYKNVYYCPTAGSTQECSKLPLDALEDRYKSDILFLGAMYPNRRKLLESIIPFVKKHKLTMKICGHVQYMPKNSPLWEYVFDSRTIPHMETVKYYNGAKVVLNILRDIHWNPRTRNQKNPLKGQFPAESLNPRAYEVPLCQAFMLLEDTRPEAREIYGKDEVGFFSDEDSLRRQLRYYLIGKGNGLRDEMAFRAYKKAAEALTYNHRMLLIRDILEKPPV